ncbi:MAG: hypothetical protein WA982_16465 [Rubrobacteraceae bacterium]
MPYHDYRPGQPIEHFDQALGVSLQGDLRRRGVIAAMPGRGMRHGLMTCLLQDGYDPLPAPASVPGSLYQYKRAHYGPLTCFVQFLAATLERPGGPLIVGPPGL